MPDVDSASSASCLLVLVNGLKPGVKRVSGGGREAELAGLAAEERRRKRAGEKAKGMGRGKGWKAAGSSTGGFNDGWKGCSARSHTQTKPRPLRASILSNPLVISLLGHNSNLFPSLHVHLVSALRLAQSMEARKRGCCREPHAAIGWQMCSVELGEYNTTASVTKISRRVKNARLRRTLATLE